jgi:O-antigen/teichoic acid export membrane protein
MRGANAASFRGQVRDGLAWLAGLAVFREVLQFPLTVAMTRLLVPEDYGRFALVMAILTFVNVFSFRSFLEHTLQLRQGSEPDYHTHFAAGAVFQSLLFTSVNGLAFAFAGFPQYGAVAPLLHVMSLLFFLEWMSELRFRMLERRLEWRRLRMLQGTGFVLYGATALAMAVAGAGVWSLLLPSLLVTLPSIADLWASERWRPRWTFSVESFAPAWRYGLSRIGSGLAQTSRPLMENAVLAQTIGFAALGLFGRAVGLAQLACTKAPVLLTSALFPILTRIEPGSERYRRAAGLVLCTVAWLVAPAVVVPGLLSEPAISWLYGTQWVEAAVYLPLALVGAAAAAVAQTASMLLLAGLHPRICLIGDLMTLVGTVASLAVLLPRGAIGYLAGVAAVNSVWLAFLLYWLVRTGSISTSGVVEALVMPMPAVLVALLLQTWMTAPAAAALFLPLYAISLRMLSAGPLSEVLHYCPGSGRLRRILWLPA